MNNKPKLGTPPKGRVWDKATLVVVVVVVVVVVIIVVVVVVVIVVVLIVIVGRAQRLKC